jgi:hypothetical protein
VGTSAANLLDGDLSTLWTTNRLDQFYIIDLSFRKEDGTLIDGGDPAGLNGFRHWITVDLGQVVENISKLEYYPRKRSNTTQGVNQIVEGCEIYASEEVNLKINIKRALDAGLAKKVGEASGWSSNASDGAVKPAIIFTDDGTATGTATPVDARYIQLRVTDTSSAATDFNAAVGEIKLYTNDGSGDTALDYATLTGVQAYADSHNGDQRVMFADKAIDGISGVDDNDWLSGPITNAGTALKVTEAIALKANLPADPHFDVGHWITLDLGASPPAYTGLKYHRRRDNNALGNFSGVEIYASDSPIDPAQAVNSGMILVKIFTGLPIGTLNNVERWTLLDFGQPLNKRYLHIRITGEVYSTNAGYGNGYNAGPNTGSEVQPTSGGQLGVMWGSAAAAEFTIVR